jgi:hypothetical protein
MRFVLSHCPARVSTSTTSASVRQREVVDIACASEDVVRGTSAIVDEGLMRDGPVHEDQTPLWLAKPGENALAHLQELGALIRLARLGRRRSEALRSAITIANSRVAITEQTSTCSKTVSSLDH